MDKDRVEEKYQKKIKSKTDMNFWKEDVPSQSHQKII